MEFINLYRQYKEVEKEVNEGIHDVLSSQSFIQGRQVFELERKLSEFVGRKHTISCSSGTDALVIPLMAYKLESRDAIFCPSFTFFATAESISLAGGTPIFIDSDRDNYNMDLDYLEESIKRIKKEGKLNPRGIISVDIFGLPCDYDRLESIAKEYNLFLIEDAAQSFGASYKGKRACSFGDVAATSFFPAKPLGCYGDGGAIFTDDDDLAEKMRSIRVHGQGNDKYTNIRIGMNGRLDTLQAVVLLAKLKVFEKELVSRDIIAKRYTEKLKNYFETPDIPYGYKSAWAQYTIEPKDSESRERIIKNASNKGIPLMIYYKTPLHLQEAYRSLNYKKGSLPICEEICNKVFSIPMHPYLSDNEIEDVVKALLESL